MRRLVPIEPPQDAEYDQRRAHQDADPGRPLRGIVKSADQAGDFSEDGREHGDGQQPSDQVHQPGAPGVRRVQYEDGGNDRQRRQRNHQPERYELDQDGTPTARHCTKRNSGAPATPGLNVVTRCPACRVAERDVAGSKGSSYREENWIKLSGTDSTFAALEKATSTFT